MPNLRGFARVVLIAAVTLLPACGRRGGTIQVDRPNVLLVTIDTLRADRLGCYGHPGAMTPAIDALARRGVRFDTAVVHAPLTGPSHASILTGLAPLGHGFRNNSGFTLTAPGKTAAEIFTQAGYETAAFISGFPLDRRFGFSRGFGTYDDYLPRGADRRRTPHVERFADATTNAVLKWLAAHSPPAGSSAARPWFLWVHYYDPHAPYEPPADLAARYRESPYDGEIAFVDREIARLLQALDSRGETARTISLVTADHGESLGAHGEDTHGIFVYDATLRVPWVMAGPGISAGRVSNTVARSIDVLPTLLDYAGISIDTAVDGRSLRPAADGREMPDAPSYAESLYAELELGWAPLHAWRTAEFKYIYAPKDELYDLRRDASETQNRIGADPTRARELERKLQAELRRPPPAVRAPTVDPETAERLRALGYVGGRVAAKPRTTKPRDPKDGIRLITRLNRGMAAARAEPEVAIGELSSALDEEPDLFMARRNRAVAYTAAGRYELAIADLRLLEKQGQLAPDDGVLLGDNLRFAGRLDEAALVLQRASQENPTYPQPLLSLADVRVQQQKYEEASALCEKALTLVPDHIEALRRLGDIALFRDQQQAAAERYSRILALDATDAGALTKLGVIRARAGQREEATRLFREAVQHDPENADALLYLAGILASAGQPRDALPYFQRALELNPRSTMALNGLGLTRLALGDRPGAETAFRASLRLDPTQEEIARSLNQLRGNGVPKGRAQ